MYVYLRLAPIQEIRMRVADMIRTIYGSYLN